MADNRFACVFEGTDPTQIEFICSLLESHDIQATTRNIESLSTWGLAGGVSFSARVLVPSEDVERANQVLEGTGDFEEIESMVDLSPQAAVEAEAGVGPESSRGSGAEAGAESALGSRLVPGSALAPGAAAARDSLSPEMGERDSHSEKKSRAPNAGQSALIGVAIVVVAFFGLWLLVRLNGN